MRNKNHFLVYILLSLFLGYGCSTTTHNEESASEVFDSSLITAKVKSRLIDDPMTGVFQIKVSTTRGIVELSGTVENAEEKQQAGQIARAVEGVTEVHNNIEVTPAP